MDLKIIKEDEFDINELLLEETNVFEEEQTRVFTWPYPNAAQNDENIDKIIQNPDVEHLYSAVGQGRTGNTARFNNTYDKVTSLDALIPIPSDEPQFACLIDGEVTSKDVKSLVEREQIKELGISNGFELEYSRNPTMQHVYSEKNQTTSETFRELAKDSQTIVNDKGAVLLDIHDYKLGGLCCNEELKSEWKENPSMTRMGEINYEHLLDVAEAYSNEFEDVQGVVVSNHDNLEQACVTGERYLIAQNPF